MALVQLTGGKFQDAEGNVLSNGYLTMQLSHDEQDPGSGTQLAAGLPIRIQLDNNGNVSDTQKVWATDVLLPANAYYIVEAFRSDGTSAWLAPQFQTVATAASLDIGTWIPNNPASSPPPLTITLQTNGVNNQSQTLLNLFAGTNMTLTNVGGRVTLDASGGTSIQGIPVSAATPRIGDTFRYNEYGDSKWDIVQGVPKYYSMYSAPSTVTASQGYAINISGAGTTPTSIGTQASVLPTATEPVFQNSSKTAVGSTSTAVGVIWINQGGPTGSISLGTMRRWQARVRLNNTSSVRYWVALSDWQSTIATTTLATDTPNLSYVGFRFSATTDTTIKAVTGTSNVLQTVVDTGVSVDTVNSQLFDIVYTSSSVFYYINGALVATITTTIPAATVGVLGCLVGDNKNTATAMSIDVAHMIFTLK